MKLRSLAVTTAVVSFIFGLGLALIPQTVVSYYGRELSDTGIYIARLLGAAFLGVGVLTWSIRNLDAHPATRSIFLGIFVMDMIGGIVSIIGQVGDPPVVNALGWISVVIYLGLGLGWGALYFFPPEGRAIRSPSAS